MPIGTGIVYNTGDLILSQVSSSGTAFLETKIAAATGSLIYFDSTARINSASLNSITVGTASYVSGSTSIITNLTASNISASGNISASLFVGSHSGSTFGTSSWASNALTASFLPVGTYNITSSWSTNALTASSVSSTSNAFIRGGNSFGANAMLGLNDNFRLDIETNGTAIISLTGSNVGIGTTNPAYKLDVVSPDVVVSGQPGIISRFSSGVDGRSLIRVVNTSNNNTAQAVHAGISFVAYATSSNQPSTNTHEAQIMLSNGTTGGTNDLKFIAPQGMTFWVSSSNVIMTGSGYVNYGTQAIAITPGGFVGIGTASPVSKLHISGSGSTTITITDDALYTNSITNDNSVMTYTVDTGNAAASSAAHVFKRYTTELVRIDKDGHVGIGTSDPTAYLHIYGQSGDTANIRLKSSNGRTYDIGSTGTSYGSANNFIIYDVDSSAERFRINSSGNIGIGTTSPLSLLDVRSGYITAGSSASTNGSTILAGYYSDSAGILTVLGTEYSSGGPVLGYAVTPSTSSTAAFFSSTTIAIPRSAYVQDGGTHRWYTGQSQTVAIGSAVSTSERMRINSDGNLGIGTTNPVARLQVAGNISGSSFTSSISNAVGFLGTSSWAQNVVSASYALTSSVATSETLATVTGRGASTSTQITVATAVGGSMYTGRKAGSSYGDGVSGATFKSITDNSQSFATSYAFAAYYSGSTGINSFYVSSNGDGYFSGSVGIGTTSPGEKLTVSGNSYIIGSTGAVGTGLAYYLGDSSNRDISLTRVGTAELAIGRYYPSAWAETIRFTADGNVGIGTTITSNRLEVAGSTFNRATFKATANVQTGIQIIRTGGVSNTDWEIYSPQSSGDLRIYNGSDYVTFQSGSGSVGIGTTSPNSKLEVAGPAGTAVVSVTNSGNGRSGSFGIDGNGVFIRNSNDGDYFDLKNASGVARFRVIYDNATHLTTNFVSIGNLSATGSKLSVFGNTSIGSTYGSTAAPTNGLIVEGNVGIGTTVPGAKLEISASSNSALLNIKSPSSSTILYISGSGAVGVGTSAYTEIGGNGYLMLKNVLCFVSDNTANSNNRNWSIGTNGQFNGDLYFVTSAGSSSFPNDAYRISFTRTGDIITNGSIGVGTTVPVNKLQVNGNVSGSSFTSSISNAVGFLGTSSWAQNVVSASYATTAQTANALNTGNSYTIAGLTVNGTLSQQGTLSMGSGYQILATTGTVTNPGISFVADTNTGFYTPSADNIGIVTNGSEKVRIDSSGNVGVGSSSPSSKFEVLTSAVGLANQPNIIGNFRGDTDGRSLIRVDNTSTSAGAAALQAGISFVAYSNVSSQPSANKHEAQIILGSTGATSVTGGQTGTLQIVAPQDIAFNVSASNTIMTGSNYTAFGYNAMYIARSGNVGIGTTTPVAIVDIQGTNITTYGGSNTGSLGTIYLSGNDAYNSGTAGSGIYFRGKFDAAGTTRTTFGAISAIKENNTDGAFDGALTFFARSGSNAGIIPERMRISSVGNVGIGTTNPGALLELSSSTATTLLNIKGDSRPNILYVSASGNVAINSSVFDSLAPEALLISGSTYNIISADTNINTYGQVHTQNRNAGTAASSDLVATNNTGTELGNYVDLGINSSGYTAAFIGNANDGYLYNTGSQFYIGNASPGRNLYFFAGGTSNTASMMLSASGNVGIGATSPNAKLDVRGYIVSDVNGNAVESGFYLGSSAHGIRRPVASNDVYLHTTTGNLYLGTTGNTSQQVTVLNSGNVGIGTVTPAAKLEITGSSNSALLNIKSPISGAILYVSGSGAVGIGTSNVGAFTLQVSGSFGATTKSFIIDHPTKAGKKLMYGSLESPYHGIRLTGRDTLKEGKCKVELPDYIYKLILHDSINIQLTGIKCNKTLYVDDINIPENYFTIAYDKAIFESYKDYEFFWDFTAIRADVPELTTEL